MSSSGFVAEPGVMQGLAGFHMMSGMKTLNELDFESWEDWKLNLMLMLTLMGLDYALSNDQPTKITNTSSPEQKVNYERWERSNRLCLMIMKQKLSGGICGFVRDGTDSAKQFLAQLEDLFNGLEKAQACSLLDKFVKMKYDGHGNVREHILKMSHVAKRLRSAGIKIPESLVVHFAIDSLPSQFRQLQVAYRIQEEEWGLNKVVSLCASEEERLRQDDDLTENIVSSVLGKRGQTAVTETNRHVKNEKMLDECDGPQEQNANKRREIQCYSCGSKGHVRKDCHKYN